MQFIQKWQPKQGVYRQFYKNGEINIESQFEKGLKYGFEKRFRKNGQLKSIVIYINGVNWARLDIDEPQGLEIIAGWHFEDKFQKNRTIKTRTSNNDPQTSQAIIYNNHNNIKQQKSIKLRVLYLTGYMYATVKNDKFQYGQEYAVLKETFHKNGQIKSRIIIEQTGHKVLKEVFYSQYKRSTQCWTGEDSHDPEDMKLYINDVQVTECAICFEQIGGWDDSYVTKCGHIFCENCWSKMPVVKEFTKKCPLCYQMVNVTYY